MFSCFAIVLLTSVTCLCYAVGFLCGIACVGMYQLFLCDAQIVAQAVFLITYQALIIYKAIINGHPYSSIRALVQVITFHTWFMIAGIWFIGLCNYGIHWWMGSVNLSTIGFIIHDSIYCVWSTLFLFYFFFQHQFPLVIVVIIGMCAVLMCPLSVALVQPGLYDYSIYNVGQILDIYIPIVRGCIRSLGLVLAIIYIEQWYKHK